MKYTKTEIKDVLTKVEMIVNKTSEMLVEIRSVSQIREALQLSLSKLNDLQADINKIKTKMEA